MSKHMVICKVCGKRFDANKGGFYDAGSRRYICPKCGKAHNRAVKEVEADRREAATGMRQKPGAMIAKIAIGLMFFFVSFGMEDASSVVIGLVIGLALIAWGLLPWLLPRLKEKKAEAAAAEAAAKEAKLCPYCGAPTKGDTCEYCGSPLPKSK